MNPFQPLLDFIPYVVAFVPMLGILIFVHELGHFMAAKSFGVRVLTFSLGFGAPIGFGRLRLRWVSGDTEYKVGWIPLGGYVKMLGEELHEGQDEPDVPDARPDEYLNHKPLWQKLGICFAGPVMNLLLPVVIFMGVFAWGLPQPSAVVGHVEAGSPAALGGLEAGDRIVAVDGVPVRWWFEFQKVVAEALSGPVEVEVEHDGVLSLRSFEREARPGMDAFGGEVEVGWIGVSHRRLPALVGVLDLASEAGRSGLRSGDRVIQVDGVAVEDWEGLRAGMATAWEQDRSAAVLRVVRGQQAEELDVSVSPGRDLAALGVVPATILVSEVSPGMPAEAAGIEAGDWIVAVDGAPVGSFAAFAGIVRSSGGRKLTVRVARDGESKVVELRPRKSLVPNLLGIEGMEEETWLIGIRHALPTLPGASEVYRSLNPIVSFPKAVLRTVETTRFFLAGLGKIVSGEVGADKLAGPIGIAEIARKSLDLGWLPYLQTLILISINLGILNLLPIPVLDGGQALLYMIESAKRSPLSLRTREIVQSFGLTMVLMLIGLAFWNDLSRHWGRFIDWLQAGL